MRIGISSACLYPEFTEDAVEKMGSAGVKYSEVFINSSSELQDGFIHKLKEIKDRHGMQIISMHPYTSVQEPFMLFTQYLRRYNDALESYKLYFEAMNTLGTDILVFHGDRKQSDFSEDSYFERFLGLKQLGETFGVIVAQENVERCKSRSSAFLTRMKNAIPDVRFVLDIKQAVRAGENPFEILDAMGKNIAHVHLSDHTANKDCLPVGEGIFDIKLLLTRLKSFGFDGGILLELYRNNYKNIDDLVQSQDTVKDILLRM